MHGFHEQLKPPENVDLMIHSGDCSNWRDPYQNEVEVREFIYWYSRVKIPNKIYVAGNHCTSIEKRLVNKEDFTSNGIIYLENSSVEIEGLKIWGSPVTPNFCNWSFMKSRDKLHDLWQTIPEDSDIVITHGPAKTILDLSYNREGVLEYCGCNALKKRILQIEPKLFLFGHLHNCQDIINSGWTKLSNYKTIFSNGSCVTDGKFDKGLTSFGNTFEI